MPNPEDRYSNAVLDWNGRPVTVREGMMLKAMDLITDLEGWEMKIMDQTTVQQWREKFVSADGQGFSNEMFDFCLAELLEKSRIHKDIGMVRVFDIGATVVKSDSIISACLREEIRNTIANILEIGREKDWNPGSAGTVLNLIDPSLFSFVYGRSRVQPYGTISLNTCLQTFGLGDVATIPWDDQTKERNLNKRFGWDNSSVWSPHFQWLPCEVRFTETGVSIESYINNLHPVTQRALYPLIEQVISAAIPLWSEVLGYMDKFPGNCRLRIDMRNGLKYEEKKSNVDGQGGKRRKLSEKITPVMPQPREYQEGESRCSVDSLRRKFTEDGLQVMVKATNIMLTPEKPEFEGRDLELDGLLNDRICATAHYYYDCENVTNSYIGFRQKVDTAKLEARCRNYENNPKARRRLYCVEHLFNLRDGHPAVQDVGHVSIREGRLLAYPNVFLNKLSPFSLKDRSKPGHQKVLTLFLVDPHTRVLSTANVPPQRKDWWLDNLSAGEVFQNLPDDLSPRMVNALDDWSIGIEEARLLRRRLIEEQKTYIRQTLGSVFSDWFDN
ncbi:hypothetical protein C8J57DRAFT_1184953 [Neofusicoccum parvum]|uniref:Uncharacterized protein n=1 Tax=Neofusicoccum parvum TaxID=310453 RepID=A0ACB5SLD0_9PEZI|nr:hypothetical protein C8J57DRAFT_1184953 [Neofusicoccum parvum]